MSQTELGAEFRAQAQGSERPEGAGRPPMRVYLASPRGFCAGVDRAIQIVEAALEKYGAPIYVRHEIVHNRHVVERLESLGTIFVDDLAAVPDGGRVIFSAHGVPKSVPEAARKRSLFFLDATCPLVSKVHAEAAQHYGAGRHVILIGHAGHPEVIGTMGQIEPGAMTLVESIEDVAQLTLPESGELAYVTQTTLSMDATAGIIQALKDRFPDIIGPRREDICYATTNRQNAVKAIAPQADVVLVMGAPNSSNSMRLVEMAREAGCDRVALLRHAEDIDWEWLGAPQVVGVTAGASAPEELVEGTIAALRERFAVTVEEKTVIRESVRFRLPRALDA